MGWCCPSPLMNQVQASRASVGKMATAQALSHTFTPLVYLLHASPFLCVATLSFSHSSSHALRTFIAYTLSLHSWCLPYTTSLSPVHATWVEDDGSQEHLHGSLRHCITVRATAHTFSLSTTALTHTQVTHARGIFSLSHGLPWRLSTAHTLRLWVRSSLSTAFGYIRASPLVVHIHSPHARFHGWSSLGVYLLQPHLPAFLYPRVDVIGELSTCLDRHSRWSA